MIKAQLFCGGSRPGCNELDFAGETPAATATTRRLFESLGFELRILASRHHSYEINTSAALVVLLMCIYAFLLGNKTLDGKFENEAITWYILAKGIFCSVALVALSRILDGIIRKLGT